MTLPSRHIARCIAGLLLAGIPSASSGGSPPHGDVSPTSASDPARRLTAPAPPPRVAQLRDLDVPPDSYMMIVAYRGSAEVGRWGGPIDFPVAAPSRLEATRDLAEHEWRWREPPPGPLRVNARRRERGGEPLLVWASELGADRVLVVVIPHPGEPEPAARHAGLGTRGSGHGRARVTDDPGTDRAGATPDPSPHDQTPRAPNRGPNQGGTGAGTASARGPGTHESGQPQGQPIGARDPSWVVNPNAQVASSGGRTPADHGQPGGSASGQPDAQGHLDGAGWLNLLDLPARVAPAVAAAIILTEADVLGFGQTLVGRSVRGLSRQAMDQAIEREAKAAAKRLAPRARERMATATPRPPPASHVDEVMAHMPHQLELRYYHQLARQARERADLYQRAATKTLGQPDEPARYAHRIAQENHRAWLEIESACQERIQATERALARPPDSLARQPYNPHKQRSELEAKHPGKVTSTTVPGSNHPNVKHRGQTDGKLAYDIRGFPILDDVAVYDMRLSMSVWKKRSRSFHQRAATRQLREAMAHGRVPRSRFTEKQLEDIEKGRAKIRGYTWHHHQDVGRMQLVPEAYHDASAHVGGFALWGRGR